MKENDGGRGSGEEDRGGTGAGLATSGSVLLCRHECVSEVSDKATNHAPRWLVGGHK